MCSLDLESWQVILKDILMVYNRGYTEVYMAVINESLYGLYGSW